MLLLYGVSYDEKYYVATRWFILTHIQLCSPGYNKVRYQKIHLLGSVMLKPIHGYVKPVYLSTFINWKYASGHRHRPLLMAQPANAMQCLSFSHDHLCSNHDYQTGRYQIKCHVVWEQIKVNPIKYAYLNTYAGTKYDGWQNSPHLGPDQSTIFCRRFSRIIVMKERFSTLIKMSLTFVPRGLLNNKQAPVEILALNRTGNR